MINGDNRTVIFVGGTAYSGSTFFDMMLANDPRGFSCGEVHAFFRPFRPHHHHPPCGCGDHRCTLWGEIRNSGEARLYRSIFQQNPDTRFIVDSSKSLPWITAQAGRLAKAGIQVRHILIWKSPAQIARSFHKRGRGRRWTRSWANYHRLYFRLIPEYRTVNHFSLVDDPAVLEQACAYLGIGHFPGKAEYWNKRHHTLFGNTSAKIHTRDPDSGLFEEDAEALAQRSGARPADLRREFRTIHISTGEAGDDPLLQETQETREEIAVIEEHLQRCGVGADRGARSDPPAAGTLETLAHQARWKASHVGLKLLPRNLVHRLWPGQSGR